MKRSARFLFYLGVALAILCWVIALAGCASAPRKLPTHDDPLLACEISCGGGGYWTFRAQHLCGGGNGRRLFSDVQIVGEHVERGPDGTVNVALWITRSWGQNGWQESDLDKRDVVMGTCDTVVRQIIAARAVELRGRHAGEDDLGRPKGDGSQ